uniref:Uncharacterized protein n=1 Tax=Musa acuminata subsp. malaccensis TaxID=214687 RepID=A0A804ILH4_MUSAM
MWRSRTWSGARSCRPSPTPAPAATCFRSPRRTSASARRSPGALAAPYSSPSSTTPRTSPPTHPTPTTRRPPSSPRLLLSLEGLLDVHGDGMMGHCFSTRGSSV